MFKRRIATKPVWLDGYEIDWSNDLARGLGHAIYTDSVRSVDMITGEVLKTGVDASDPTFGPRLDGALEFNGSNQMLEVADPIVHNGKISVFTKAIPDNVSTTGQLVCADDHSVTPNVRVFQFRVESSGSLGAITFAGGVISATSAATLTVGQAYSLGLSSDYSLASNQLKLFIDGEHDGSATQASAIDSDSASLSLGGRQYPSAPREDFSGAIGVALVWTQRESALTEEEHALLHANPYQLLKPKRKLFIVPSAGAAPTFNPAWAARTNNLIGGM